MDTSKPAARKSAAAKPKPKVKAVVVLAKAKTARHAGRLVFQSAPHAKSDRKYIEMFATHTGKPRRTMVPIPDDLQERLEAAVRGPWSSALVALAEWALNNIDEQHIRLRVLNADDAEAQS